MLRGSVLFFLLVFHSIYSQSVSPGGVSGETLWLKPIIENGNINFKDYSIYNQAVTKFNYLGFPKVNSINFNPAIELSNSLVSSDMIEIKKQKGIRTAHLVGVYMTNNYDSDKNILNIKNGNVDEMIISTDKIKKNNGEVELDYGKTIGQDLIEENTELKFKKPKILSYYRYDVGSYNIWGQNKESKNIVISSNELGNRSMKFGGLIPEIIFYDRVLTPLERKKVESYLAIKYGIHLEDKYFRSDDIIVWDQANNSLFDNRVAGIGKDNASGLLQPKSSSTYDNPSNLLTISQEYFEQDNSNSCSDCIKYGLLTSNNVTLSNNILSKSLSGSLWGNDGGLLDTPLEVGDYLTFTFGTGNYTGAFLGLSNNFIDNQFQTADYGIKKEGDFSNKLSWCKKGNCSPLLDAYTGQTLKIKLNINSIDTRSAL